MYVYMYAATSIYSLLARLVPRRLAGLGSPRPKPPAIQSSSIDHESLQLRLRLHPIVSPNYHPLTAETMAFTRTRALRSLQASLRHSGARATPRIAAPARTQLAATRRYASGGAGGHGEPTSDIPW